ncbi:hypothetical protein [Aquella oligotrophica]|uniref:Uncharacterized protein n=1 Tax=Aquella oligotrophica TaxID=2067065 RepID=A0A2I7N3C0_9NEIS|nr:hypothetical protein [Aquella oligotrophica]AUR50951.1 hypothetical protein CUN60_01070 [Aquella oligotrophica]
MCNYRLLFLLSAVSINVAANAEDCFTKYKAQLDDKKIMLAYTSNAPDKYMIGIATDDESKLCSTTYQKLTQYLDKNYRRQPTGESSVIIGWNYLSLNNKVVYDFMADISPDKIRADNDDLLKNTDFKSYMVDNQALYKPVSIINNQYACYYHQQFSMATGMAHPYTVNELLCSKAGDSSDTLKISQIADEKQMVSKLLQTDLIKKGLAKTKIPSGKILTYDELSGAMAASRDSQLGCIAGTINGDNTGFTIDKLNSDGTINITLGLTSDIHACSSIFIPLELKNIKPLMRIKVSRIN